MHMTVLLSCVSVHVCVFACLVFKKARGGVRSLELEFQSWASVWVLETEPESSRRAASTLHSGAISQPPTNSFLQNRRKRRLEKGRKMGIERFCSFPNVTKFVRLLDAEVEAALRFC